MRKCNYCEEKYSSSTSTGHVIKHRKTSHCMSFNQTKDYQTVLTADEIYQIDSALLWCLIFCFLSFSIVENRNFKEFVLMNPSSNYKLPCRKTLVEIYEKNNDYMLGYFLLTLRIQKSEDHLKKKTLTKSKFYYFKN